jgi:hypothetical protein
MRLLVSVGIAVLVAVGLGALSTAVGLIRAAAGCDPFAEKRKDRR